MGATKKRSHCCCCRDGATLPRWENITKVRPAGDTGGPNYTHAPFARWEPATYIADHGYNNGCNTLPPGSCYSWIFGGDLNGVSAQWVENTVNDIMQCAGNDTTHYTDDHNCYVKNGTVNLAQKKRFGGQWILGRKHWHGIAGPIDRNDPHIIIGANSTLPRPELNFIYADASAATYPPPAQETYLTKNLVAHYEITNNGETTSEDVSASSTVNRWTGITTSATIPPDFGINHVLTKPTMGNDYYNVSGFSDIWTLVQYDWNSIVTIFCRFINYTGADGGSPYSGSYFVRNGNNMELWSGPYTDDGYPQPDYPKAPDFLMKTFSLPTGPGGTLTRVLYSQHTNDGATWKTKVDLSQSISVSNQSVTARFDLPAEIGSGYGGAFGTATCNYTNPYTAAQVLQDFYEALAGWDMSDFNLGHLRTDSALALGSLCCWDEREPSAPILKQNSLMDDLSVVHAPGTATPQRAWLDASDFIWRYPGGGLNPYDQNNPFYGGATLESPMHGKRIISHTQILGADRHFWFGELKLRRDKVYDSGASYLGSQWVDYTYGSLSDFRLSANTMRWMTNQEAQFDGEAIGGYRLGNLPQDWLRQNGRTLTGGKFVQAVQNWQSVDYARPCGQSDKYLVDQPTVCCVISGGGGSYLVKRTGEAIAPMATGGLTTGNLVAIEGDGVYHITGISYVGVDIHGFDNWTITVGSLVEALPAGFTTAPDVSGNYIGRLRFHDSAAADCSLSDRTPQRTGVRLVWTFDQRRGAWPTAWQPNWLGGTGAGTATGTVGCTSLSISQFSYNQNKCKAIIGGVPYYSPSLADDGNAPLGDIKSGAPVEDFKNQVLFPMPSTFKFDPVFGAVWQGATEQVMPDPFWQRPAKPDCAGGVIQWIEDDGSHNSNDSGATPPILYFRHKPWVEAASVVPTGKSLPAGVNLFYAPGSYIAPPFYPAGIPIGGTLGESGDADGRYAEVETAWGFTTRACNSTRWSAYYASFVTC